MSMVEKGKEDPKSGDADKIYVKVSAGWKGTCSLFWNPLKSVLETDSYSPFHPILAIFF